MITPRLLLALAIAVTPVACGGGQTSQLKASSRAPAAEAKIDSEDADNGNTKVTVEVKHMAPPDAIAEDTSVYVVWVRARGVDSPKAQNLGAIAIDKDRKGKLETVTPLKNFDVLITPETSAQLTVPAHAPVLTGKVER